ncbi:hypothetical protein GE09DRAFT_1180567 [Coniochaeta sp. 2T2.1]|nr:hypothetical protein GE09DRAFT_1180567 [Coniochaeta sp. 2T2.1]
MCRMVVFMGTCPRCAGEFTWEELSQQLSCLEAKNVGGFGECRRGANYEYHTFDQDCPTCTAELNEDEGVDLFEPPVVDETTQGGYAQQSSSQGQHHGGSGRGQGGKEKGKGKSKAGGGHDDDAAGRRKKKQRTS